MTPDPIGLEGGINLFVYVQNNPVNFYDPYGLSKSSNPFSSNDPLVQALKRAIPEGQNSESFKQAMKNIRHALDKADTSKARRQVLRGAMKVGKAPAKYAIKYGIKLGALLGLALDLILVDHLNADEMTVHAMYLIKQEIERLNVSGGEPCPK